MSLEPQSLSRFFWPCLHEFASEEMRSNGSCVSKFPAPARFASYASPDSWNELRERSAPA